MSCPSAPTIPVYHYRAGFCHYRAGFHSGVSTIPLFLLRVPAIPVYHYRAGFHGGITTIIGLASIVGFPLCQCPSQVHPLSQSTTIGLVSTLSQCPAQVRPLSQAGFHSGVSTIPVFFLRVPTIPVYHYRAGFHSGISRRLHKAKKKAGTSRINRRRLHKATKRLG